MKERIQSGKKRISVEVSQYKYFINILESSGPQVSANFAMACWIFGRIVGHEQDKQRLLGETGTFG